MKKYWAISIIFILCFFSSTLLSFNAKACKDIIVCGDATAGNYNLFLKVRDPSRPGLQVLSIVPQGYKYTYRYPWTGKPYDFTVSHKFIGVATEQDIIPNIVKAGMSLSSAGIAYGDADTGSNWNNPTKNAWDDFDMIRYACQEASTEKEAVDLLTKDIVKKLHASDVSENLFVVGPKTSYIVEEDAFHYKIKEIKNGIAVMSNYPKELWKTQILKKLPISPSFDTQVEKTVRKGQTLRLRSIRGIRILDIQDDYVTVKPVPFLHAILTGSTNGAYTIKLGERKTVGYFSIKLLEIENNRAKISMCNIFKAWEDEMLSHIEPYYGSLDIKDMMNFSRLDKEDLNGLRPMCEDLYEYESVAIYKIPNENYDILSSGWFSSNHACSSIYVPFHICDTDIFDPYETGEAAEISLNLFKEYDHNYLSNDFSKAEDVFLNETDFAEKTAIKSLDGDQKISNFLTTIDTSMQKQAYLTQQIWQEISKITNINSRQKIITIIQNIWVDNYSSSVSSMKNSVNDLMMLPKTKNILEKICEIALNITNSRIDAVLILGESCKSAEKEFEVANNYIKKDEYESGFNHLETAFIECDNVLKGKGKPDLKEQNLEKNLSLGNMLSILAIISVLIAFSLNIRINQKK